MKVEIKGYNSGRIVLPGEKLCVVEEFYPGEGTYEDKGEIKASRLGMVLYDYVTRRVRVLSTPDKNVLTPKTGYIVYGQVYSIHEDIAYVKISEIENHKKLSGVFTGVLHVSQVSQKYVKTVEEAVKLGDIIRAKVLTPWSPYQLTTKHEALGVVLGLCSNCGSILWYRRGRLICKNCGNVESRKVSTKYILRWSRS